MPPLTGLEIFFGLGFYKDAAPTALGCMELTHGMNMPIRFSTGAVL